MDSLPKRLNYKNKTNGPSIPRFKLVAGSEIEMKNFTNPGWAWSGFEEPGLGLCRSHGNNASPVLATLYSQVQNVHSPNLLKRNILREAARIGSMIIFHLTKLWKPKFSILCDVLNIFGQASGKIWNWSFLGVKRSNADNEPPAILVNSRKPSENSLYSYQE